MGEYTSGAAMDAVVARLMEPPLVWMEDGYFVFRDPKHPGFTYDFLVTDAADAMGWVAHMAEKNWVTTDHLEQFARLVTGEFKA